ncbi:MAG TPA: hypothetical protein DD377_03605 [Firmicutes bacterium]|nr:hypothetical protein [Bacillota bacterium]
MANNLKSLLEQERRNIGKNNKNKEDFFTSIFSNKRGKEKSNNEKNYKKPHFLMGHMNNL